MKKYNLPVSWEVCGMVEIEANSLEEAIDIFRADSDSIPLPEDSDYVDGSFDLSCPEYETIALYNKEVMRKHCNFCGWDGSEADLDFDEHDVPKYCPECGHSIDDEEEKEMKYNPNFTPDELTAWVENYKENNSNWSMLDFCYMDKESGDIVIQKSNDGINPIWVDIYNENELDVCWIGEEGCAGNFDMYMPIYSAKSGLIYFLLGSQNHEYLEHEIIVLHGRKPDDEEKKEIFKENN